MKVATTEHTVCETCSSIVVYGYSDSIEDCETHQAVCNKINAYLPDQGYWLDSCEAIDSDDNSQLHHSYNTPCCICDDWGTHLVQSAINTED